MGVQGLTTYIHERHEKYFDRYKLKNTHIVIDGNSLAAVLYRNGRSGYSAFGGDYDKYAKYVEEVFNVFSKCDVVPIVVFDGAYERKKFRTLRKRGVAKVRCLEKVTPASRFTQFFPLLMRQVFRDKLFEMEIATAQSDFEADGEIAALARKLNCPVMSNDSDFFIFDVVYIPLTTVTLDSYGFDPETNEPFIACEVYRVERLLDSFGGLSKKMLPLLAAVLGNDYIERSTFKNFFSHVKLGDGKGSAAQRRVSGLFQWLQKESFHSALFKILGWIPKRRRKLISNQIKKIVKGYTQMETPLDAYLPAVVGCGPTEDRPAEMVELEKQLDELVNDLPIEEKEEESLSEAEVGESDEDSEPEVESDSGKEESEDEEMEAEAEAGIPQWVLEQSRRGRLHCSVMTLLTVRSYFFVPQIEDYDLPHAGEMSLPLLRVLAGLLIGGDQEINFYARARYTYERFSLCSAPSTKNFKVLPCIGDLPGLTEETRRQILLDTLELDSIPSGLPEEWTLFVLAFTYWVRNSVSTVKPFLLHTVVVMLIAVSVMDSKIGHFRKKRSFLREHGSALKCTFKTPKSKVWEDEDRTVSAAVSCVTTRDCLVLFESFLPYFHFDLKNDRKTFCKSLVHRFVEFQTVLDFTMVLNSVLSFPFPQCRLGTIYSGTFLYNFATNLKNRTNLVAYMETFCAATPTVLHLYKTLVETLLPHIPQFSTAPGKPKKKKPRAKKTRVVEDLPEENETLDLRMDTNDNFVDPENPYSVLSC